MNSMILEMLNKYEVESLEDRKNAIKEIIQEIVLCGLSRARFFDKVAFYGGTALRIFYGLDRFSEDLDFSLKESDPNFELSSYFSILEKEIMAFGLNMSIEEKEKSVDSNIKSAFLKGDTKEHLLIFYPDKNLSADVPHGEMLKIKFEIDVNPPKGAAYQHRFSLKPTPYEITLYDQPSLFAGKLHAVLCRGWKNRIKGRDLYDYIFYLQKNARVNIEHLKQRLIQSAKWERDRQLTIEELKQMLYKRFDDIDYESAKEDVKNFIKDKASLELWSADFFKAITEELK